MCVVCAGRLQGLAKRVIACLDVRANDNGDLVVTKGDQYDVRESTGGRAGGQRIGGGAACACGGPVTEQWVQYPGGTGGRQVLLMGLHYSYD